MLSVLSVHVRDTRPAQQAANSGDAVSSGRSHIHRLQAGVGEQRTVQPSIISLLQRACYNVWHEHVAKVVPVKSTEQNDEIGRSGPPGRMSCVTTDRNGTRTADTCRREARVP